MSNNAFVFLYPQEDILTFEMGRNAYFIHKNSEKRFSAMHKKAKTEVERAAVKDASKKELKRQFNSFYSWTLNQCIDLRYRSQGFTVYYAVFDQSKVSSNISVKPEDKVIHVGMDAKTHRTKSPDNLYPYPDPKYIIDQMQPLDNLVVAGFHIWDCVERLAKKSHEMGIKTLVDEDLTDLLVSRMKDPDFMHNKYPTYNPRKGGEEMYDSFMRPRLGVPWLWQKY